MNLNTSIGELRSNAPVIVIERNPDDLWKVRNISHNHKYHGILLDFDGKETNFLPLVFIDDQDLISRKLGAAILQSKPMVTLRYRLHTGSFLRWIEEQCILTYSDSGLLQEASGYLWFSPLPTEWALLSKGSETWNALNSKIRHDILNQLTAILGYLELSSDLVTDPMLQEFCKKEQNAAEKIRDRLIFTREYQKIGMYEFCWYTLEDIIRESLNEIVLNPINLTIESGKANLFTDKNFCLAIEKILENIPEHAKGVTKIKISLFSDENISKLVIEDNGCGIPEQQKNRIFDLGFGLGKGYGLFLAERILSVYGISLVENGIPGQGTRFELTIPQSIIDIPGEN
ncbi:MAG: HAMP domain-containing histidine kinase [Methanomicrobiales archaeon]|nr:HAMP domain-containing histidine kinase [Methanomicrobiales archaeon]